LEEYRAAGIIMGEAESEVNAGVKKEIKGERKRG